MESETDHTRIQQHVNQFTFLTGLGRSRAVSLGLEEVGGEY